MSRIRHTNLSVFANMHGANMLALVRTGQNERHDAAIIRRLMRKLEEIERLRDLLHYIA